MNKHPKERLHLFRQVEEVLREMNLSEVKECSEATLQSMKHNELQYTLRPAYEV